MYGQVAFITAMVVLGASAWMVDQGGAWIFAGVLLGVPAALVWAAGLLLGVLALAERRDANGPRRLR